MKRRTLLVAGGACLAFSAARLFGQSAGLRRIALVHPGTQAGYQTDFNAFRSELKALGHIEGKNISIEARWAEGKIERLDSLAAEMVALNPAVIITGSSSGVVACRKATSSIPIVFATAADPVEQGFVSSLRRPGGNVTGIAVYSGLNEKIVEVARQVFPMARRLAILVDDKEPFHRTILKRFEASARRLGIEPIVVRISRADELDRAFNEFAQSKADALIVPNLSLLTSMRQQLVERTRKARLPLLSTNPIIAEVGGLLSYGTSTAENWRRAAALADKILRGANPGDLPVEQPDRIQLVINMKTAKAVGVSLSPTIIQRADKIIE
jgi:putative ABC transport system substrate-binding protein